MEKQFIKIESTGLIDPKAFSLIGASTKRNDNTKIGFFGSGLKYSIAYLLRERVDFKVFSEYTEIKFEVQKTEFREQEFEVIYVDGKETSMTTQMGIDWKAWFIIREIYCNAIDEGDSKITTTTECLPVENKTVFYIEINENFKEIIENWDLYFSLNRKGCLYSDDKGNKIFPAIAAKRIVYRKGIQCCDNYGEHTLFSYDFQDVQINESRVIASEYQYTVLLSEYWRQMEDGKLISMLVSRICDAYDGRMVYEYDLYWNYENYHPMWVEVLSNYTLVSRESGGFYQEEIAANPNQYLVLPEKMVNGLVAAFGDAIQVIGGFVGGAKNTFKVVPELTTKQTALLNDSVAFLKECNYVINYPIKVVQFMQKDVLGRAYKEEILLSEKLFDYGRKQIVACLIEEQEHLVTGFEDESRAFQSHFINLLVTSMETKTGIYL